MAVDAASAAAAVQDAGAKLDSSRTRLAENFETFLALLTTQLKNQDPLSPMDSNEFTQQIVQMTGVEQQLLTNDLLKKLVDSSGKGIGEAVSLIGKEVKAPSTSSTLKMGEAKWTFDLEDPASSIEVKVLDPSGRVMHSRTLSGLQDGEHDFSWNGKDLAGKQLPNGGAYTLQVTAKDAAGEAVASKIYAKGIVSAVEQTEAGTMLTVGTAKVLWNTVVSITEPQNQQTAGDEEAPATQG